MFQIFFWLGIVLIGGYLLIILGYALYYLFIFIAGALMLIIEFFKWLFRRFG